LSVRNKTSNELAIKDSFVYHINYFVLSHKTWQWATERALTLYGNTYLHATIWQHNYTLFINGRWIFNG